MPICQLPTTTGAVVLFSADVDGDGAPDCIGTVDLEDGVHVLVGTAAGERDLGIAAMHMARPEVRLFAPPGDRVLVLVGTRGADVGEIRVLRVTATTSATLFVYAGKSVRVSDDRNAWPTIQLSTKEPTGGVGTLVPKTFVWNGRAYESVLGR